MFDKATHCTILLTDFKRYADNFNTNIFVLEKRKFNRLLSLQYLDTDNSIQDIDSSNYYLTDEYPYSRILLAYNKGWGDKKLAIRKQAVTIKFTAGLSNEGGIYASDIKFALLNIISQAYFNRGDCNTNNFGSTSFAPTTNSVIAKYRIMNITNPGYTESNNNGYLHY
jgi:hypothetical protein